MSGTNSDLVPNVRLYGFGSAEDSDGRRPTVIIEVNPDGVIEVGVCRFTPPSILLEVMSRATAKLTVFFNHEMSRAIMETEARGEKEPSEDITGQVEKVMAKDHDGPDC